MFKKVVLFAGVLVASVGFSVVPATADSGGTPYSWTGGGDGHSWGDASNWEPSTGYPGQNAGDSASISPNGGVCTTIDGGPGATLTNLSVSVGSTQCPLTLEPGVPLTVSGTFVWNGGAIDSGINLLAGSVSQISGSNAQKNTLYGMLNVAGTLSLADLLPNSPLYIINAEKGHPSGIHIKSTGSLMGTSDAQIDTQACCVSPVPIVNDGELGATGGTFALNGVAVVQNKTVNISNDATLVSDSGTLTSATGGAYTGSGTYRLQNNATAALGGTQHLAKDFRLELGGPAPDAGAHLGGTFTLAGPGTLAWTGGQLEANLTVAHGATLDAEGVHANNGNRALDGRDYTASGAPTAKLINHGTVKLGGGAVVTTWDAAEFDNESDGNLVIVPSSGFTSSSCCVDPAAIVNAGGTVSVIAVPNAGTTATLDGVAYRATGGTTSIAGGRTLQLSGGATGLLSDTTIEGTGTLAVATPVTDAKTVTVNKQTTVSLQTSGSLNGTATLGGTGSFQWTGGNISGDLTVSTGDATVSGTTDKVLATVNGGEQTSKLRFKAPTTFPADAFVDLDRSTVTLAGTTTMRNGVELSQGGGVVNTGHLILDPGKNGTVHKMHNGSVTNSGTIDVRSGTFTLDDGLAQTDGKLDIAKGAVVDDTELGPFTMTGGQLTGTGTFRGTVRNKAIVAPAGNDVGQLTVDGDYTQLGHGILALGFDSAKSFDSLHVTGIATMSGHGSVKNAKRFAPGFGSHHVVVTAASLSGSLSCVSTTGGGTKKTNDRAAGHWAPSVGGSRVVLTWTKGAKTSC